jgi:hypothetical protein
LVHVKLHPISITRCIHNRNAAALSVPRELGKVVGNRDGRWRCDSKCDLSDDEVDDEIDYDLLVPIQIKYLIACKVYDFPFFGFKKSIRKLK